MCMCMCIYTYMYSLCIYRYTHSNTCIRHTHTRTTLRREEGHGAGQSLQLAVDKHTCKYIYTHTHTHTHTHNAHTRTHVNIHIITKRGESWSRAQHAVCSCSSPLPPALSTQHHPPTPLGLPPPHPHRVTCQSVPDSLRVSLLLCHAVARRRCALPLPPVHHIQVSTSKHK